MNFLKKLVFIPVLGLVLTGCNAGTATVTAAAANERVAKAMGQTALSGTLDSLKINLTGDLELTQTLFDTEDVKLGEMSIDASASLELKAKGLSSPETLEASLLTTGSLKFIQDDEEVFNSSVAANAYVKDMWLYLHLSGIGELLGLDEDEVKGKTNIEGMIDFDALPVPTSSPTSEEFDEMTGMMETILMEVDDVKAVETNGNLLVTYTITTEDIVDVVVAAATLFDSEMTTSELAEMRQEGLDTLNEVLTINTAKIVVGVSKLGYLNKLELDLDFVVVVDEYDDYGMEIIGYSRIGIDTLVKFDMEINGNFTIAFPGDLSTYQLMDEPN